MKYGRASKLFQYRRVCIVQEIYCKVTSLEVSLLGFLPSRMLLHSFDCIRLLDQQEYLDQSHQAWLVVHHSIPGPQMTWQENSPTAKDGEVHNYGFKSGVRGLVPLPLFHLVLYVIRPQDSSELDTLYYLC